MDVDTLKWDNEKITQHQVNSSVIRTEVSNTIFLLLTMFDDIDFQIGLYILCLELTHGQLELLVFFIEQRRDSVNNDSRLPIFVSLFIVHKLYNN